jgi:hypothetical protein
MKTQNKNNTYRQRYATEFAIQQRVVRLVYLLLLLDFFRFSVIFSEELQIKFENLRV